MRNMTAGHDVMTPSNTAEVLKLACLNAHVDDQGAQLMRIGSNAVYMLPRRVVARLSRGAVGRSESTRAVEVALWLASVGFPAVRALDVPQPVEVGEWTVTFWHSLSDDGDHYGTTAETAELLRGLHQLEAPASLVLPSLRPFGVAAQRIQDSAAISPADREFLAERLTELEEGFEELDFALPQGVIHGDANVGNVLRDHSGRATLIDLDGFSIGPREWDLALTAVYFESFGWHTREEYEEFVSVYGFDVMKWSGYPVMRNVRELLMTIWLCHKVGEDDRTAGEARKRLSALRKGTSRKDWSPF